MRYIYDNDYHIHSQISDCSSDPEQTPERILEYAKKNKLKKICLTDHFWDSSVDGAIPWYQMQDYNRIVKAKPLPQADGIEFLFGCETDLDKFMTLGIAKETFDLFDFVIIPTTHLHMNGFTLSEKDAKSPQRRAELWVERLDAVLNMDLPFHKIGIAHLACPLIARPQEAYSKVLEMLRDDDMERLFKKAAMLGVGIELNGSDMNCTDEEAEIVLRPFRIAKACGCKFYIGSDAHHPKELNAAKEIFERAIDRLDLKEEDKFILK